MLIVSCLFCTIELIQWRGIRIFLHHFLSLGIGYIWIRLFQRRVIPICCIICILLRIIIVVRWSMNPRDRICLICEAVLTTPSSIVRIHICIFQSLSVIIITCIIIVVLATIQPTYIASIWAVVIIFWCFTCSSKVSFYFWSLLIHSHFILLRHILISLKTSIKIVK